MLLALVEGLAAVLTRVGDVDLGLTANRGRPPEECPE